MKLYILSLMKDQRNGFLDRIFKGGLLILSWFYFFAVKIVDWSYNTGIRKIYKSNVPVISVGNITLGGTGKTPFTIFLAEYFLSKGNRPAVLIRGYGQDECKMIADEVPDVKVFVGQDRVKSAKKAELSGKDLILLDDGFQHRRLGRDLNIVLVNAAEGLGNSCLFPRGVLREPVSALKRADMVVITKIDSQSQEKIEILTEKIKEIIPNVPISLSKHKPSFLTDVTGAVYGLESLAGNKVCAVSAIGDPGYFSFVLEENGAHIVSTLSYPDHYSYTRLDIVNITKQIHEKKADKVVMTKKDFIKLKNMDIAGIEDKIFVLNIVIDVVQGEEKLLAGLNSVLVR